MIAFDPSDEQAMILKEVGSFAKTTLRERYRSFEQAREVPDEVRQIAFALGAGFVALPEAVGGAGLTTSFSLTNQMATSVVVLSGDGQSVVVGSAFEAPIVIQVTDASGNPIAGVTVTLAAPGSGASATFWSSSPGD